MTKASILAFHIQTKHREITDLNNLYNKTGETGIPGHRPDFSDNPDKAVITQLQEELERQRIEHEVALQTVRRGSSDEIEQLKHTIVLIRDELEKTSLNTKEAVQNSVASATEEIRNLKETVINLRAALDEKAHETAVSVQKVVRRSSEEIAQLKKTIVSLRDKIEIVKADSRDEM